MKLVIKDRKGNSTGEHEVGFEVITSERGTQAVHDYITAYRAGRRSGSDPPVAVPRRGQF